MFQKYTYKPDGVKDILQEMSRAKRELENIMYNVFSKWGYEEVITPSFEYLDTFMKGTSYNLGEKVYKFFDRKGNVLALRPDMTTPIARLIGNHFENIKYPLRLSYFSNIFRFEESGAGRQCEFHQAGIELIGNSDIDADAEVIALGVECLKEANILDFKVNIGHTGVLKGIIESFGDDEESKEKIYSLMLKKDFVTLKNYIQKITLDKNIKSLIIDLIEMKSSKEIIDKLKNINNEHFSKTIKDFEELEKLLNIYEISDYIKLDLSLLRALDYYTGIIFEIYSQDIGVPICGGGRYDNLIEKFNGKKPATGFAFYIEGLLKIIDNNSKYNKDNKKDYLICYDDSNKLKAVKKSIELRNKGYIVELVKNENLELGINENLNKEKYKNNIKILSDKVF